MAQSDEHARALSMNSELDTQRRSPAVKRFLSHLRERVVGQGEAIEAVLDSFSRVVAGIRDQERPILTMLLLGPTGVGKTEIAKALAETVFGRRDAFVRINCQELNNEGSVAKRLLTLWGVAERGTPLRSMVRRDKIGPDFRLPQEESDSLTPGQTLLMHMVAAGPAVRVPETLYLRWQREGGLTGGWRKMPYEKAIAGFKADVARVFSLIDELVPDPTDREILKIAQTLHVLHWLSGHCRKRGLRLPLPTEIHPDSPGIDIPEDIDRFGEEIATRLRSVRQEIGAAYSELT